MIKELTMPKYGETMETGIIARWYYEPGDTIIKGDVLCQIETDKVSMDYESPVSGKLIEIVSGEGDEIPVLSLIAKVEVA